MNMHRGMLCSLIYLTMSSLSCGIFSTLPASRAHQALPAVSAPSPLAQQMPVPAAEVDELVAAIRAYLATRRTGLTAAEIGELAYVIVEESRRHEIDPALVMAVMHVESRFNAFAVSPVGARGLMQIMPFTGEELALRLDIPWHGPRVLFDPVTNVRLGVAYLRELSDRFGSVPIALAAYNWGPGRIGRRIRRGSALPQEYPRLVLDARAAAVQRGRRS
jgi:soluble lytic murein transglycosylase-like protein